MSGTSVCSILAVLLIAVHSSMAFPSNIHEKMTNAERLEVFGSNSVPDYGVFPASLPGARSRREANKNISLELELDGRKIVLNLKPTKSNLATKHTPVWSAESDKHAYEKIRYDPLPTAISDIGEFKMYHDVENEAAVTVYEDPVEGSVMVGIVTAYYAIKSLPKRLMGELLKVGPHVVKTQAWGKRSILSDTEDQHYYVLYKFPAAPNAVNSNSFAYPNNLRREIHAGDRGKRNVQNPLYPEILIILDDAAVGEHQHLTQALRFTLAFWNGIDSIYRALDNPKVYLNIAGIIIARDPSTTPYIVKDQWAIVDANSTVSEMGRYFWKEKVRFPINRYDMIIAMTRSIMFAPFINGHKISVNGYSAPGATACTSIPEASKSKTVENTGVIQYGWYPAGVVKAAEIVAYLLGAEHSVIDGKGTYCDSQERNVIAEYIFIYFANQTMQWSDCSRRDFSRYFSSEKSVCLRNEPLWIDQVGEVLPGRWLTLDGQCENEGYAKACKFEEFPTCTVKGCQADESDECVRTERAPLPGSKCEAN